jgi:hypothetical protein
MRKHIILFFSALLFLFACNQDKTTKDILNEDDMANILTQVHLVDGSLAMQAGGDSLYKYGTGRYIYLFKQYKLDTGKFKRSMKYYSTHPDVLVRIYDVVSKNIQTKYDSINKIVTVENSKKLLLLQKEQAKAAKLKADSAKKGLVAKKPVVKPSPIKATDPALNKALQTHKKN